jgi:hypothetical protein
MKAVLALIVLGVLGYFGFQKYQESAPVEIDDPVFAEMRVDIKVPGRELNFVLYGKMASELECRTRAAIVWGKAMAGCKECSLATATCSKELAPRYAKLFDNQPIRSTYMSFTRGAQDERDGRMVIYGLTADEGDAICDTVRKQAQTQYEGKIECIKARRD